MVKIKLPTANNTELSLGNVAKDGTVDLAIDDYTVEVIAQLTNSGLIETGITALMLALHKDKQEIYDVLANKRICDKILNIISGELH